MKGSKQSVIKEKVIEYMKDGKEKSTKEIKSYLEQNGIKIEKGSSALKNAMLSLKQENDSVHNIRRGVYIWKEQEKSGMKQNEDDKYDFSDFITVMPSTKREADLVVSIFQDGTFAMNTPLFQDISEKKAEIKIKKDCSELAIIRNGNEIINLGKNGRIKNYDIVKILKENKKKFPVYYIGKWNEEKNIWMGKFSSDNPNKATKKKWIYRKLNV